MKNSILILGIALVSLTNVSNASNVLNFQKVTFQEIALLSDNEIEPSNEKTTIAKPETVTDSETFNPETVLEFVGKTTKEIITENDKITENTTSEELEFMVYEDSMRDIIAQSDLIIENTISNETYPLSFQTSIETEIAQLELIIESTVSNEVSPLNIKEINKNVLLQSTLNTNTFLGMN
ncbi:hypothetical protein MCETHM1_01475 [Flavobacteriaceae bacterium]